MTALGGFIVALQLGAAMPVKRQNELVQRHCAVCHTDAAWNGGLTLQHFDVTEVDPSLAAMLLSKLRGGAMGVAGLPFEKADADYLEMAMICRIGTVTGMDYYAWASNDGGHCSRSGGMQLSWAPSPRNGTVKASVDGGAPLSYKVELSASR